MDNIRYSRSAQIFRAAVEHLATDARAIRERMMSVDKELFLLCSEDLLDSAGVRQMYAELRAKATHLMPKGGEGVIAATIQRSRLGSLSRIATLIVEIDRSLVSSLAGHRPPR